VERLRHIEAAGEVDREAEAFVRDELCPAWASVAAAVRDGASQLGDASLAAEDRCLSPSDFGYHNALLQPDGRLRFLDFEYAGWDDPAKLVCDFFCQPAVPAPRTRFGAFAEGVVSEFADPAWHLRRIELLFPVYRIKWCCIVLNDFLPVGRERRRFSSVAVDQDARKAGQLRKARRFLEGVN
jgi:hypothetical protein